MNNTLMNYRLIEPGGYLQWTEVDILAQQILRSPNSQSTITACQKMAAFMEKPRGYSEFRYGAVDSLIPLNGAIMKP